MKLFDWLLGAQAWSKSPHRSSAVRTRVQLPATVQAHPDVLRPLRVIDPMLDYYVMPDGAVLLLKLKPGEWRIREAQKQLALPNPAGRLRIESRLALQGFAMLADLYAGAEWNGKLFEYAARITRKTLKEAEGERERIIQSMEEDEAEGRRRKRARERARAEGNSDHRILFRRRSSVNYQHIAHWPLGEPTRTSTAASTRKASNGA